jgi:hypothetical protein
MLTLLGGEVVKQVRTFATTTAGLLGLCDWLSSNQVSHVARGSTGVYWRLEVAGLGDSVSTAAMKAYINVCFSKKMFLEAGVRRRRLFGCAKRCFAGLWRCDTGYCHFEYRTGSEYRWFSGILCVGYLAVALIACSQSTTAMPKPAHPTATPLSKGALLYRANWSKGLAGWQATAGWRVVGGDVQTDGKDDRTLTVPYRPVVSNYAIEFRMRIVTLPPLGSDFGSFLVSAEQEPDKDGYQAGIIQIPGPGPHPLSVHPQVEVYTEPVDPSNPGTAHDQEFGFTWHSYRIEVRGGVVNFSIDGQVSGRASSNQTSMLSHGPIQVEVSNVVVEVSDFRMLVA